VSTAVVIGGGISGLAAARRLAAAGLQVTVCEASGRWGGKLAPVVVGGLTLDGGAESLLARRPEAVGLLAELGLEARRTAPTAATPRLLLAGRPVRLPPSLQGVPTDPAALAPLLSAEAAAYAAAEPDRPAPPLSGDVPIGGYVDERFGPEVTDRLLEPLLGGVYAGRARSLSFEAVAPDLFAAARAGGSLAGHARATLRPRPGTPVFAGLVGGVHGLAAALVDALARAGVDLRAGSPVTTLSRRGDGRFDVGTPAGSLTADVVVLAAPAAPAARLLAGLVPVAADLAAVPYASTALVTLVVRGLVPEASGLLVPPGELPTLKALTYSSTKWSWVGDAVREPYGEDAAVVRASVGRAGEAELLQLDDDALVARSFAEASGLPGWPGTTLAAAAVTRWGGALPQYTVGHRARVERLRAELTDVPGLAVAGAVLDGVGVPACLASAERAVTKVLADLDGRGRSVPGERIDGPAPTGENEQ
jgi:oxygen-dependent protoporphyrinogen oxidase